MREKQLILSDGWWLYSSDPSCKHGTGWLDDVAGFIMDDRGTGWLPVIVDGRELAVAIFHKDFHYFLVRDDVAEELREKNRIAWDALSDEEASECLAKSG